MKVLFVIAEAAPFVTSGGLGEIGGSLPKALAKKGVDVRVALPKYSIIAQTLLEKATLVSEMKVSLSWRSQYCAVWSLEKDGITYYFFENDYYFYRDFRRGLYGFYDEAEQYAFFCRAVLDALPSLDFVPDVIHCHDWHTALIPILLNNGYQYNPFYTDVKTVFTIHNVKYQGVFPFSIMDEIGLEIHDDLYKKIEFYGAVNFMKGAIYYAQRVNTVSPTYAEEIKYPYFGEKLDGVLCANDYKLSGIINGIDEELYDPNTDPYIFTQFKDSQSLKGENKTKLTALMGLPGPEAPERIPLLAIVTRFVENKGIDLIQSVFHELMAEELQMVVLGSGDWSYEHFFSAMAARYPDKLSVYIGYDVQLAHRIYAAADMLLMPSRFEPCGIAQMIAMRYGTIPIVRETGGLKDTVRPFNKHTGEGNGFSFANYNAHELLDTIRRVIKVYSYDETWQRLFRNALSSDFGWDESAKKYIQLYEDILE